MQLELSHFSNSLSYLIDQVETHNPFSSPENLAMLSEDFLSFVKTSTVFDQVRLLDMHGQEFIRANYSGGATALTTPDQLQNKSSRYYFQEGLQLDAGKVYLSPLDLNVEQGKIELPIKPTLRLVQPAMNDHKQIGMVVVNVLGDVLLEHVREHNTAIPGNRMALMNMDGYWLAGPEPADLWGFMYPDKQELTLAKRSPRIWQAIADNEHLRMVGDGGVYLSDTFHPGHALARIGLHVDHLGETAWKLVAFYPDSLLELRLAESRTPIMFTAILIGMLVLIILIGGIHLQQQAKLRRQAELKALEAAFKAENAQTIVTIAGGIGHEFNNILAGISSYLYLIRKKLADQPELTKKLDATSSLAQQAARLVNHLMTFAQVDINQKQRFHLDELVRESLAAHTEKLEQGVLQSAIESQAISLYADPDKLRTIIDHLLTNACDAIKEQVDGEISVSLSIVGKDLWPEGMESHEHVACLSVNDNGNGIADKDLPHIFEPFYTTKPVGAGEGMGLAYVHGAIRRLKGAIRVKSEVGKGTAFSLFIPVDL